MIKNILKIAQFSEFKTKFEPYRTKDYSKISQMYEDLLSFQNSLTHLEVIKYSKALESMEKKVNRLHKSTNRNIAADHLKITKFDNFSSEFSVSKTYQFFYSLENEYYKTSLDSNTIRTASMPQLYELTLFEKWQENLDKYYIHLANKQSNNNNLVELIKKRAEYFEQYLCMNVFKGYKQFYKKSEQEKQYKNNSALKKLMLRSSKDFKSSFKFELKQDLTPSQIKQAIEIGAVLTKMNFYSKKLTIFNQQCLIQKQITDVLDPDQLMQILFCLGHYTAPILKIDNKLHEMFEIFAEYQRKTPLHFLSLLFYMLANKIENYSIFQNINEELKTAQLSEYSYMDKQLTLILAKLLKIKHGIEMRATYAEMESFESDATKDFEQFLQENHFDFTVGNSSLFGFQDVFYEIENKKIICMNSTRINPTSGLVNGIGAMILDTFYSRGEHVKMINPELMKNNGKWGKKQEYLWRKMKGINRPVVIKDREFGL